MELLYIYRAANIRVQEIFANFVRFAKISKLRNTAFQKSAKRMSSGWAMIAAPPHCGWSDSTHDCLYLFRRQVLDQIEVMDHN